MITVEQRIKRKLAASVAAGIGQWADSPGAALGKPIYHVKDGPVTLVLSELGFTYDDSAQCFECPYDEIEVFTPATLVEIMRLHRDPRNFLTIKVKRRGVPAPRELKLPVRVYSSVAPLLGRIVNELG